MNEKAVNEDFDSVFSDLLDGCEDLRTFFQDLQKLVPDAVFRLYSNDGYVVQEDDRLGLESETYDSLIKDVAEDGSVLSFFELPDKSLLYCRAVPQINSILFFKFPGCSPGIFPDQVTFSLFQSVIEHALLKKKQEWSNSKMNSLSVSPRCGMSSSEICWMTIISSIS